VSPNFLYDFDKFQPNYSDVLGPYDFQSIMHYNSYAASTNGLPTLTANRAFGSVNIGTLESYTDLLTTGDRDLMARLYGAPDQPLSEPPTCHRGTFCNGDQWVEWQCGCNSKTGVSQGDGCYHRFTGHSCAAPSA